ncbi:MAG: hypothetical protein K2Y28_13595 [Burkholderiaceae bacterium]|nr:hypothetical protein [Burkholderiaceae bacterium]
MVISLIGMLPHRDITVQNRAVGGTQNRFDSLSLSSRLPEQKELRIWDACKKQQTRNADEAARYLERYGRTPIELINTAENRLLETLFFPEQGRKNI